MWRHDRRKGSGKKERVRVLREGGTQVSGRHEGVRERLRLKEAATGGREAYKEAWRTGEA